MLERQIKSSFTGNFPKINNKSGTEYYKFLLEKN